MSFLSSLGSLTSSLFEAAAPVGAQLGGAWLSKELGLGQQVQGSPVMPQQFGGGGGTVLGPLDLVSMAGQPQLPAPRRSAAGRGMNVGFTPGDLARMTSDARALGGQRVKVVVLADGSLAYVPFKRRRRINYLNPKALSRATRRVNGFARHVKRTRSSLRKLASL